MRNRKRISWRHGLATLALLLTIAAPSHATRMLVSGNAMDGSNTNLTNAITGVALQAVFVAPSGFAATDLAGFDAVWLDGFSKYHWSSGDDLSAKLGTFMAAGGNVFVQNPGFGSEELALYPLGAQLAASFTYPPGIEGISIVDTTGPLGANHAINQGLVDAGLSDWDVSAYGYFTSIGAFTGLTDTGTAGQWITIASQVGSGYLVYTQQGVSQFLGTGSDTGAGGRDQAARFLSNVVTLSAAAPEPSIVSLVLFGLGLTGLLGAKRHERVTPRGARPGLPVRP
jgi:hypothetical protein